jgi:hypothetical protein
LWWACGTIRYRNNQLLEVLAVRKVPLLRATWYIKIVQLNNNRQKAANKVPVSLFSSLFICDLV